MSLVNFLQRHSHACNMSANLAGRWSLRLALFAVCGGLTLNVISCAIW